MIGKHLRYVTEFNVACVHKMPAARKQPRKPRKRPPVKPKNKPKPNKRVGVKSNKRAVPKKPNKKAAPKKKVAKPPVIPFNARGDNATPYRSCQKSKVREFCDIPQKRMEDFIAMLSLKKKRVYFKKQCPRATNCDIISGILPAKCMRGWRITRYLGKGSYGYVFGARSDTGSKKGALKIQPYDRKSLLTKEIRSHRLFAKLGLTPELHFYCTLETGGHRVSFLSMGRIDTTLEYWLEERRSKKMLDLLVERLFKILDIMRKKGVTHGDFHPGNIGFVFKREGAPGKIQLLDHGWSSTRGAMTEIEVVQLMRTLHSYYLRDANKNNTRFLLDRCQQEAKRRYGLRITRSLSVLDKRHRMLHNEYLNRLYT